MYEEETDWDDFTNTIFKAYKEFEKEIQKVFGDIDKKLYA
jgi:hypothetical protein